MENFESFRRNEHRLAILPGVRHGQQDQRIVHAVNQRPLTEGERTVGIADRLELDQQKRDRGKHHPERTHQRIHSARLRQLEFPKFFARRRHFRVFANHFHQGSNGAVQIGRSLLDGMIVGVAHVNRRLFETFSIHSFNSGCFRRRQQPAEDNEKTVLCRGFHLNILSFS